MDATMQALMFVKPKVLEWREVTTPGIDGDGQALVRPTHVARCDLDSYIVSGQQPRQGPFQLGHEMVGEVIAVGDDVRSFEPGERVIVPFQINCGECVNCRRGLTNACQTEAPFAAYGLGTHPEGEYGGGLSDCVRVPYADAMLLPCPDSLESDVACHLSDNLADGYRTVAPGLARWPGEAVLVIGGLAQSVGLFAVQAAVALGASRVVYLDRDPRRLALARRAGAEAMTPEQLATAEQFLVVADASGTEQGLQLALRRAAPCAQITGVTGVQASLKLTVPYLKGFHYTLERVHSRALLPEVLSCTCEHGLGPAVLDPVYAEFRDAAEAMFDASPKVVFRRTD